MDEKKPANPKLKRKAASAKGSPSSPAEAEKQLAGFISKFDPVMAVRIRAVRGALRRRFPTAFEIVYDNYNFFVIGYCSTQRPSDCIVSLAANSKGVGLSFYYGATLPDPAGILEGSGSQNRFVRINSAEDLESPAIAAVIRAAIEQARTPLSAEESGYLIIKSVSAKQRPRR